MSEHILLYVMSTYTNQPAAFVAEAFVYIDMNIEMINKQMLSEFHLASEHTMALEKREAEVSAYLMRPCGTPDARGWGLLNRLLIKREDSDTV